VKESPKNISIFFFFFSFSELSFSDIQIPDVSRICISDLYFGSVILECISDLYFSDVSRNCISRMCSDDKFLGSSSTSRIYFSYKNFSDLYEMKSSRISYFLGLQISRMLTNKTFLGCQISRMEISRMWLLEKLLSWHVREKILGSDTVSEKALLGSDSLSNPRDVHKFTFHVSKSDWSSTNSPLTFYLSEN
jgi:hypothetical protein